MLTFEDCGELAVLDIHRHSGWSLAVITALRSAHQPCAVITLLDSHDLGEVTRSLSAGAIDCLARPISDEDLLDSFTSAASYTARWRRRLLPGARPLPVSAPPPPSVAARPRFPAPATASSAGDRIEALSAQLASRHQLTKREGQVLYWLLAGHRYDDIAISLGIASRTAKYHASNLLRKLDIDSRHDLPRLLAEVDG